MGVILSEAKNLTSPKILKNIQKILDILDGTGVEWQKKRSGERAFSCFLPGFPTQI